MRKLHSENIHPGRRARRSRPPRIRPSLRPSRSLCFASGATTYQIARRRRRARLPHQDRRRGADRPDLRMQLVDRAEIADFVLVDDFSADEPAPCRSATPIRTVALDADAAKPDVTVSFSRADAADYKIYVHSVRFSQQDAAAILAAMWKTDQQREATGSIAGAVNPRQPCRPVQRLPRKENRKGSRTKIPSKPLNKPGRRRLCRPAETAGEGDRRSMQVRPVTGMPRKRYRHVRRLMRACCAGPSSSSARWRPPRCCSRTSTTSTRILRSVAVRDRRRRAVLPAVRHHADGAVAQQPPLRMELQARQDPLRGAGRQQLGIQGEPRSAPRACSKRRAT